MLSFEECLVNIIYFIDSSHIHEIISFQ